MPAILKDHRFWIGVAGGFFVGPAVAKFAKMQIARAKGGA